MAQPPSKFDRESSATRGYGSRWQKAREGFLRSHPLCKMHQDLGRIVPATVVDHIEPHRGDMGKFWDRSNWQSLCKRCHDGAKQRLEKSGVLQGCRLDGIPVDPKHPWAEAIAARR
ncbi:HNH endonuclease [Macromonas nakdongensis]|uniref:HNH endonuclease n=1 Tax=Macromonas nakdongensis TaxID=1843082 RepID=UPI000C32B34B|nr:HNH endonuclease signature motif containing protein [Macromonas nakdongensis]